MRFLCLHGRGTNSDIFESQIQSLLSKLSPGNTYEFVDGDIPCDAAFGVDLLYPGPYLCYYDQPNTSSIRSALDKLQEIIEEDGPFDGVIGFSQGAALVASLLLCHQIDSPLKPLPFKVAVFIASGLPLSPSPNLGKDITLEALTAEKIARLQHSRLEQSTSRSGLEVAQHETDGIHTSGSDSRIFAFDPEFALKASIVIPTVHILGSGDPWAGYSKSLVKLCRNDLAKVIFHGGCHEVPRNPGSLNLCADVIADTISVAQHGN